jgi:hypothetical protein
MASLGIVLNQKDLPESRGFDPIPEGWYQARIKTSELKPTQNGQMIVLGFEILGPTHAGRLISFQNLNIKNTSADAERIGMQQLGEIMGAAGLASIQDTDQLIGITLQIKVKVKPAGEYTGKDGVKKMGDARNEVRGYKAIEGGVPPMPAQGASMATPAAGGQAGGQPKAPWQK